MTSSLMVGLVWKLERGIAKQDIVSRRFSLGLIRLESPRQSNQHAYKSTHLRMLPVNDFSSEVR